MKKLKHKLLKIKSYNKSLDKLKDQIIVIKNNNELKSYNLLFKNKTINDAYFKTNNIIILSFFDGSVPERYIKYIYTVNNELVIKTNKSDIKMTTMDLYHYLFFIEVKIDNYKKIKYF